MMPVREGRVYSFGELDKTTFKGLPGMLADSLPDTYGPALFERWLALTGRTSGNAIETLCFLGKRCMGALEFEPAIDAVDTDIRIEVDSLVDVAREALADKSSFNVNISSDKKAAIAEILRLGTSAGGQRAKAIIAYNKATGEIRSGQVEAPDGFDYYIIKLDGRIRHGRIQGDGELRASGILLLTSCEGMRHRHGGMLADRREREGPFPDKEVRPDKRCKGTHANTLRYRALRLPASQGLLLRTGIRRDARAAATYKEAQEMFRRMVFNVVVRNQDDHTKNISFLMDRGGKWHLSPAYDMGYAYNPNGQWTSAHQMSINGKFSGITKDDLLECAAKNNIKNAARIIDEVCQAASMWPEIARECEVPQKMIEEIRPNMIFF